MARTRKGVQKILASYKMVNVTDAVTHPPRFIIEYTALCLFRYDDYLADNRC